MVSLDRVRELNYNLYCALISDWDTWVESNLLSYPCIWIRDDYSSKFINPLLRILIITLAIADGNYDIIEDYDTLNSLNEYEEMQNTV